METEPNRCLDLSKFSLPPELADNLTGSQILDYFIENYTCEEWEDAWPFTQASLTDGASPANWKYLPVTSHSWAAFRAGLLGEEYPYQECDHEKAMCQIIWEHAREMAGHSNDSGSDHCSGDVLA